MPGRLELARLSENEQTIFQGLGERTLADGDVPDHDIVKNENRAIVCAALRRLSPFEAWVIGERFGLGETAGHEPRLAVRRIDAVHETVGRTGPATPTGAGAVDTERVSEAYFQRSYIDMGRECGLSVFRLRQVEKTALDKLRGVPGPARTRAGPEGVSHGNGGLERDATESSLKDGHGPGLRHCSIRRRAHRVRRAAARRFLEVLNAPRVRLHRVAGVTGRVRSSGPGLSRRRLWRRLRRHDDSPAGSTTTRR